MTEKHVGKKRRREVREALEMKREIQRLTSLGVLIIIVAILLVIACTCAIYAGLFALDVQFAQYVPLVIMFIATMIIAFRMNGYWHLRDRYKEHCRRFNISKDDMSALERGEI